MQTPGRPAPFGSSIPLQVPILGRQSQSEEQRMRLELLQAISQMSLAMYVQLAGQHISALDTHQALDTEHLQRIAKDCRAAAQAYFEGLGIASFTPQG